MVVLTIFIISLVHLVKLFELFLDRFRTHFGYCNKSFRVQILNLKLSYTFWILDTIHWIVFDIVAISGLFLRSKSVIYYPDNIQQVSWNYPNYPDSLTRWAGPIDWKYYGRINTRNSKWYPFRLLLRRTLYSRDMKLEN